MGGPILKNSWRNTKKSKNQFDNDEIGETFQCFSANSKITEIHQFLDICVGIVCKMVIAWCVVSLIFWHSETTFDKKPMENHWIIRKLLYFKIIWNFCAFLKNRLILIDWYFVFKIIACFWPRHLTKEKKRLNQIH